MPLSAGDKLGPYELESPLGEGGMGQVWKARDTRLHRTVAIKVAKEHFSERFEREARAIAALNHPHICTLFDVGPDYLVMEYIDGSPIKGPLPVEIALRHAIAIARALDAAHSVGIVHRDLKPANILVTKSGIKLLDFGLAKVTAAAVATSSQATVTQGLTEVGMILGTLQYMAPEQLEGKIADARSDIFAFGCVLYEILAGAPAFAGEGRASVIAAIMNRDPKPLTGASPALARVIDRCLAKSADDRWQSARDLAQVLELAGGVPAPDKPASPPSPNAVPASRTTRRVLGVAIGLAIIAAAATYCFAPRRAPEPFWTGQSLGGPAGALDPRVSPDGQTIAFQAMVEGQTQVAIMQPQSGNWAVLTHQKGLGEIGDIAWSRDSSKLYFDRRTDIPRGIFSVPVLGGPPRLVLEAAAVPCVLADGSLVVHRINPARDTQLYRFWPDSGKIEPLAAIADTTVNIATRATPDGKTVVFLGGPLDAKGSKGPRGIYTLDLESGKMVNVAPRQVFSHSGTALAVTPDGRSILYTNYGAGLNSVISVPRDGSGEMRQLFTFTSDAWNLDAAADGSIYADQVSQDNTLIRFPPEGGAPERLGGAQDQAADLALVLPDGRPLVYTVSGFNRRFEIVQPDGALSPLIESAEPCGMPAALAGEGHVAVLTDRKPIQIALVSIADGRIEQRVPVEANGISSLASSPDGKTFYYTSVGFVWSMPATGGAPRKLTPGDSVSADASGRLLFISLQDKDAIRLKQMPVTGGDPQPIEFPADARLTGTRLPSSMAGPGGLIVVETAPPDQWAWRVGLIDPRTGRLSRVPLNFDGEAISPIWTRDGKLVARRSVYGFHIWRFHPTR